MRKNSSGVRNPETVCSGTQKHPFCLDFRAGGSETHQNSPNQRFGSNGGYWVCSCEKICRKFGMPKLCIWPRNALFASFLMQSLPKSSKTLPKHHLGPNGGYWVCSCEKNSSGVPNPKIVRSGTRKHPFLPDFRAGGSEKHQNSPNHHFGSNGDYWVCSCKKFVESSVCRNCASGLETLILHHFSCTRYPKP